MNQNDFDLFFEDPLLFRAGPGNFGILYLLRRDINRCLKPGEGSWLGAMGILAGIDLLGKFLHGEDDYRKSQFYFKGFLTRYFAGLDQDQVDLLYQLRNSLLHSFGLYARSQDGTEYRFCLVAGEGGPWPLIQTRAPGDHLIEVITLHREFEKAIERYRRDVLRNKPALQDNFGKIFSNYGRTSIGPIDQELPEFASSTGLTSGKGSALS